MIFGSPAITVIGSACNFGNPYCNGLSKNQTLTFLTLLSGEPDFLDSSNQNDKQHYGSPNSVVFFRSNFGMPYNSSRTAVYPILNVILIS
jgi:hypothetical protein